LNFKMKKLALRSIAAIVAVTAVGLFSMPATAQVRQREPNSEYAARRARLRAQVDAPVVLFGYTGHENAADAYVFNQENNFFYLTGDNEEGAVLLLVPDSAASKGWTGPSEILYLHARNLGRSADGAGRSRHPRKNRIRWREERSPQL
jgi:Xaa-Pro aminopeptidase